MGSGLGLAVGQVAMGPWTCSCPSCLFVKVDTKVSAWKVSSVASSDPV